MSKIEFEKARYEALDKWLGDNGNETNEKDFEVGAQWAYEWCANETEHNQMKLLTIIKELKETLVDHCYCDIERCKPCIALGYVEEMENDNN